MSLYVSISMLIVSIFSTCFPPLINEGGGFCPTAACHYFLVVAEEIRLYSFLVIFTRKEKMLYIPNPHRTSDTPRSVPLMRESMIALIIFIESNLLTPGLPG